MLSRTPVPPSLASALTRYRDLCLMCFTAQMIMHLITSQTQAANPTLPCVKSLGVIIGPAAGGLCLLGGLLWYYCRRRRRARHRKSVSSTLEPAIGTCRSPLIVSNIAHSIHRRALLPSVCLFRAIRVRASTSRRTKARIAERR